MYPDVVSPCLKPPEMYLVHNLLAGSPSPTTLTLPKTHIPKPSTYHLIPKTGAGHDRLSSELSNRNLINFKP